MKKITSGTRGLKKNIEPESLLNALARGVGRAAGTIAKATRRIAASGEASEEMAPEKSRKSAVKSRGSFGLQRKRKKTASAARKTRASKARVVPA